MQKAGTENVWVFCMVHSVFFSDQMSHEDCFQRKGSADPPYAYQAPCWRYTDDPRKEELLPDTICRSTADRTDRPGAEYQLFSGVLPERVFSDVCRLRSYRLILFFSYDTSVSDSTLSIQPHDSMSIRKISYCFPRHFHGYNSHWGNHEKIECCYALYFAYWSLEELPWPIFPVVPLPQMIHLSQILIKDLYAGVKIFPTILQSLPITAFFFHLHYTENGKYRDCSNVCSDRSHPGM